MIPDFKTYIKESVWGGMLDRSVGDSIRKEDSVNNLNFEEFFVYLTKKYKPKSKKTDDGIGGRTSIVDTDIIEIFIPIESIDGSIKNLIIEIDKNDNHIISMSTSTALFDKYMNLERMLSNKYFISTIKGSSKIYLKPKAKPSNQMCLDLINIFLTVVDNPILEKVS